MKKQELKFLAILAIFLTGIASCTYDNEEALFSEENCVVEAVTYSLDVLPVLESECYQCHGNGETSGGIDLDGYVNTKSFADNGLLLCVIRHDDGCSAMPKNAPQLLECDIRHIRRWIENGAPEN